MPDGSASVSASAPRGGTRRRTALLALAIFAATLAAYGPALRAGWIWDDDGYVTKNTVLEDPRGLLRVWIPRETPQYYPLVFTSFWIERRLWGVDPAGYHAVNIVLHACSALLVWWLFRRLRVPGAWMIAALFALHPVHVESVAWVTERKNILSGWFYLLAAHAWLFFEGVPRVPGAGAAAGASGSGAGESGGGMPAAGVPGGGVPGAGEGSRGKRPPGRGGWWAASFLLFLASLLSKTVTASLPVAMVLARMWRRERVGLREVLPLVPFLVAGVVLGLHTAHLEHTFVGAQGARFDFSFAERLAIASRAFLFYPGKLLVPAPLVFLYPRWAIDPSRPAAWLPLAGCLLLAAACGVLFTRGRRGPLLALGYYGITIFPALGFVDVYPMLFSFVADHFQYLASLGILAGVVGWLTPHVPPGRVRGVIATFVLFTLGLLTASQAGIYRDRATLWTETGRHNPDSWMVQESLGVIHRQRAMAARRAGRGEDAEAELAVSERFLRDAHEGEPTYGLNAWNLGETLRIEGREQEAATWFVKASRQDPENLVFTIAAWRELVAAGRGDDAEPFALRILRLSTRSQPDVVLWLAKRRIRAGDVEGGREAIRRILKTSPDHIPSRVALAELAASRGEDREARRLLRGALRAAGKERPPVLAMRTLGMLLATSQDDGVRDGNQAVALLEPLARMTARRDPMVLDALAAAYAAVDRIEDAVTTAREALSLARAADRDGDAAQIAQRLEIYEARRAGRR